MQCVGARIAWIELDGSLEFSLGAWPVPVIVGLDECQRGVGFGKGIVQFQRLQSGLPGSRIAFLWWNKTVICLSIVAFGQACIGERVSRVFCDRLLKVIYALVISLLCSLVCPILAFQIILIRFGIRGV